MPLCPVKTGLNCAWRAAQRPKHFWFTDCLQNGTNNWIQQSKSIHRTLYKSTVSSHSTGNLMHHSYRRSTEGAQSLFLKNVFERQYGLETTTFRKDPGQSSLRRPLATRETAEISNQSGPLRNRERSMRTIIMKIRIYYVQSVQSSIHRIGSSEGHRNFRPLFFTIWLLESQKGHKTSQTDCYLHISQLKYSSITLTHRLEKAAISTCRERSMMPIT